MEANYYDLLEISPNADQAAIDQAYRRLADYYQPLAMQDANAARRLQSIEQAYQVLGDPRRRAEYDRVRMQQVDMPTQPVPVPPNYVGQTAPVSSVIPPAPAPARRRIAPVLLLAIAGACLLIGVVCVAGPLFVLPRILDANSALLGSSKDKPNSPTLSPLQPTPPSGLETVAPTDAKSSANFITSVVLTNQTQGDNYDPVGQTSSFASSDTFHAVIAIQNAPAQSTLRAVWYADQVQGSTTSQTKIDEYTTTTSGSRNVDMTLTPKSTWPAGTYHVDIYGDGKLHNSYSFSVQSGTTNNSGNNGGKNGGNTNSVVSAVITAKNTQGGNFDPVDPTTTFAPSDTFHAVVTIVNAPVGSSFRAVWFADDVGSAAAPNTKIDEYTLASDGSRNLDFTLKPKTTWPQGTYHVDVYLNDALAQTVKFYVMGSDQGGQTQGVSFIKNTTFARSVTDQVFDPVDPTTTFSPSDQVLHLVIALDNAPDNTALKVSWYFGEQLIDSTSLTSGGTRNLDFKLTQSKPWPVGDYHVDVSVNGTFDRRVTFQVK